MSSKAKIGVTLFLAPAMLFMIVVLACISASSPAAAVPLQPPATEEKMWQYAEYSSKLGIPWDIVLITDAITAFDEGLPEIEDKNPLDTALHFSVILEEEWHYEIVGWETDEDGSEYPIYDWVFKWINTYSGKDAVMAYANWTKVENTYTPQTLFDDVAAAARAKSNGHVRYKPYFSVDTDYQVILKDKLLLAEETIKKIIDLYNVGYANQWLSAELLAQIQQMLTDFGLRQQNTATETPAAGSLDGLVYRDGETDVVYYAQNDSRWADAPYGSDNIGGYGCGPTSMAIVVSSLTGSNVDPVAMSKWAYEKGYYIRGGGSLHALIPNAAKAFGLQVSGCSTSEPQRIIDALSDGKLVVAIMGPGTFTTSGHFMVLRGVTEDGKILVADPISTRKTNMSWDLSLILSEARKGASAGGPFWIIG